MPDKDKPITGKKDRGLKWRRKHAAACADCGKPCTPRCARCFPCSRKHNAAEQVRKRMEAKNNPPPPSPVFQPVGLREDLALDLALLTDPARARYIDSVVARVRRHD